VGRQDEGKGPEEGTLWVLDILLQDNEVLGKVGIHHPFHDKQNYPQ
jgi:hypothetical protein